MSALFVAVMLAPTVRAGQTRVRMEAPSFSVGGLEHGELGRTRSETVPPRDSLTRLRSLPTREPGFVRSYLLPRLSSQFDGLAPRHPIVDTSHDRVDHVLYASLTAAAQRGAERGARDALKNFLIETTAVGRLFGSSKRNRSASAESAPPVQAPSRPSSGFGVGISHGRPELEWRYSAKANSLRLRVTSDGAAGLSFSRSRLNQTNLSVAYSPRRQQYNLYLSLAF